jgi:hypothetical protein
LWYSSPAASQKDSQEGNMAPKTGRSKQRKRARTSAAPKAKPARAPAGKGGVAMGRTVGLPFGGVASRKRKTKSGGNSDKRK